MKRIKFVAVVIAIVVLVLTLGLTLSACNQSASIDDNPYTIVVGASATPHAEILGVIKAQLAKYGYRVIFERLSPEPEFRKALYQASAHLLKMEE